MAAFRIFLGFFIPLFVTIDAFGLVPVFLSVTDGMTAAQRRKTTFEAVATAMVISVSFMFLGDAIFRFLSITQQDFQIAGGVILLVLAVMDLVTRGKPAVIETEMVGIVPLAMPLIAGPGTLATTLILSNRPGGYSLTSLSLCVNFAILLIVMLSSIHISRVVGINALRAFSKLVMVLLAAIAVNFISTGISAIVHGAR